MATKTKPRSSEATWLQNMALRLSRVHFFLLVAFTGYVLTSDAWNLVTRELTWWRWEILGSSLVVCTIIWYLARGIVHNLNYYRALILGLIVMDIALATFLVYTERGMASRGVMFYALPIGVSVALMNRSAIFGTAILSTAAYVLAATRYFYVYFNEGTKAELYTTVGLYCASFFILAAVLWVVVTPDKP
jgi:hypothetical protein